MTALSLFAADPSEQFLSAYQSYQQGENLERAGNNSEAINKYRFAESLLLAISKSDPTWQKPVIEYRLKKTHESLQRLQQGGTDSGGADATLSAPPADSSLLNQSSPPASTGKKGPSISISPPGAASRDSAASTVPSSGENRRLRQLVEDLKGQLQEAHDALTAQKHRTGDLENAEWVKMRSQLTGDLDVAKRRISDLERDLKSRNSWSKDLKDIQKKLDDAVADKQVSEEQSQVNITKLTDQNNVLVKQLQEAQSKVVATTDSNSKIEQLSKEVEKGKEAVAQLQAKLEHSEQKAKDSLDKDSDIQKQLANVSEKYATAQKQLEQAAPLRDKIKELQAKVEQGKEALRQEPALQADLQVLQEERERLVQKVNDLGVAAAEASKVKGLTEETGMLKKSVVELKGRLDAGEKELDKARTQIDAFEKVASEAKSIQQKAIADALADRTVLEEEKARLQDKLAQASRLISSLQSKADSVPSLNGDISHLKDLLAENTKTIEQSAAKLVEAEKSATASKDEAQRKERATKSYMELLTQQNSALQDQLKVALGQIATSVDHSPESVALKEQMKKLQDQIDTNARNYAESQKRISEITQAQPDQQKALDEKEKALADARQEASKLQSQLADAAQQIKTLKQQGDEGATRLKELQDQLADRDAKVARLKKRKGNAADEQMSQENELLRGIVLRELKEQAKKAQARRLMEDELKHLNIQSDTLQQQMSLLTAPTVELSPQERALFKDAQLVISDQGGSNLQASIAAPMNTPQPTSDSTNSAAQTDTNSVVGVHSMESNSAVSPPPQGLDTNAAKQADTNTTALLPWQGKFKELLAQAKAEFDRQDYLQAENTFLESLKLSPNDYFALSNLGVVEFQLGKMKEAEANLKKASEQSTDNSFALTTLGIVHYRQQRMEDAEKVLRKSVAINSQDFTAHNYLGIVLAASGKGKAGEGEIMKAIEINPNYADAHFNLAVIYATGKPPAKMMARKHYNKSLELGSPPDPSLEHILQ
ncbi:MAG: tetratricopeptide repeat protein [bacterium]